jgi:hypothetical protein
MEAAIKEEEAKDVGEEPKENRTSWKAFLKFLYEDGSPLVLVVIIGIIILVIAFVEKH